MKRFLSIGFLVFILSAAGSIQAAQYATYNRPVPLMDYVPQEIGIYDTAYEELAESDCRGCHGSSLADRHHATDTVVYYGLCTPCHDLTEEAPGVLVTRDCLTIGCHSQYDLTANGWHHDTDLSGSGNCIACHDPNLIARISPVRDFSAYPPSIVTPTPFSCENCHWEQASSVSGNPEVPGHPSTYDHYGSFSGTFVGFHEYGKPIYRSFDTHHMGFRGNMVRACYRCHSIDPNNPSWSVDDPELIRYCEICHDVASLHRIAPHVEGTSGWMATGFHVDGDSHLEVDPEVYRTSDPTGPYQPEIVPGFSANEMCMGCHGDAIIGIAPPPTGVPVIDSIGPAHGVCGAVVTLSGANFGPEHAQDHYVQFETSPDHWIDLPIYSWTSTQIEFQVPCWEIGPGNYQVRVLAPHGVSNQLNFTVESITFISLSPEDGACETLIELAGIGFGNDREEMFDYYYGVYHVVEFVASQGAFTASNYQAWTNTSLQVKFSTFFEDHVAADTQMRNFVRDNDEPLIPGCGDMGLGLWSVNLQTIYFGDEDGSGGFSHGDTIFQVVPSHPYYFDFVSEPAIDDLSPDSIHNLDLLQISGRYFGTSQGAGVVRVGSEAQAQSAQVGLGLVLGDVFEWSNTLVKVYVDVPSHAWGATWFVWVEKSGFKSNYLPLEILPAGITYTLTTVTEGQGSVTANPGGGTYAEGTSAELTAVPASGWQFSHWTNGVQQSAANPLTVAMNSKKAIKAVFAPEPVVEYALTVVIQGEGSVTPSCGRYEEGAVAELLATGASGWQFSHWTNGLQTSHDNPLALEMSQDRQIKAVFKENGADQGLLTALPGDEESLTNVESEGRDGNNDGIVDSMQRNVASLKTSDGADVTIESDPGTALSDCVAVDRPSEADGLPSGGEYPYGFFAFAVENVDIGGETTVTLYLPEDAFPTTYYKYGPEPGNPEAHWYEFMYDDKTKTGAVIDGNKLTLYFVDGGRGDDDLEANGRIVDEGGPGSEEMKKTGCFVSTMAFEFSRGGY